METLLHFLHPQTTEAPEALSSTDVLTDPNSERQFGAFAGPLSSFYQLNMGLIGIGALAVVAIIGSRNFFSNYLYQSYYGGGGGYGQPYHDPYGGSYHRRTWNDWYDYWYGNKGHDDTYSYRKSYGDGSIRRRSKRSDKAQEFDDSKRGFFGAVFEEDLLKSIKKIDKDRCGYRLVCELEQKQNITKSEKEIIKLVRFGDWKYNWKFPGKGLQHSNPHLKEFKLAASQGREGAACDQIYSSCLYDAQQMMSIVSRLQDIL